MCLNLANRSPQHWSRVVAHHDIHFTRLSLSLLWSYGHYERKRVSWKSEKNTCLKHISPVESLHGITENEKVEPGNFYKCISTESLLFLYWLLEIREVFNSPALTPIIQYLFL